MDLPNGQYCTCGNGNGQQNQSCFHCNMERDLAETQRINRIVINWEILAVNVLDFDRDKNINNWIIFTYKIIKKETVRRRKYLHRNAEMIQSAAKKRKLETKVVEDSLFVMVRLFKNDSFLMIFDDEGGSGMNAPHFEVTEKSMPSTIQFYNMVANKISKMIVGKIYPYYLNYNTFYTVTINRGRVVEQQLFLVFDYKLRSDFVNLLESSRDSLPEFKWVRPREFQENLVAGPGTDIDEMVEVMGMVRTPIHLRWHGMVELDDWIKNWNRSMEELGELRDLKVRKIEGVTIEVSLSIEEQFLCYLKERGFDINLINHQMFVQFKKAFFDDDNDIEIELERIRKAMNDTSNNSDGNDSKKGTNEGVRHPKLPVPYDGELSLVPFNQSTRDGSKETSDVVTDILEDFLEREPRMNNGYNDLGSNNLIGDISSSSSSSKVSSN